MRAELLAAIGGEEGCRRLSADFYARVAKDAVLRPLFPGKSLRCAIDEFAAFLIQFLGGDEGQAQARWWLSLRESHGRFRIGAAERAAWLKHMSAALEAAPMEERARAALRQFFLHSSGYVTGRTDGGVEDEELAARWAGQRLLDEAMGAIAAGDDAQAVALAARFADRPSVYVGLLARMMQSGRGELTGYAMRAAGDDPSLGAQFFGGRALLHYAAGAGCLGVVERLLAQDVDANLADLGGHTPLYRVANECTLDTGPAIVRALAAAGADVNACGGVTRATPLHMAARRGFVEIARALLECGAEVEARDRKGDTPLQRAVNCRKPEMVRLLGQRRQGVAWKR